MPMNAAADRLDIIQRRPAEQAWITTCKRRDLTRGVVPPPEKGQLEHLVVTALDRCVFMGWMTNAQFAVLAKYGAASGPKRTEIEARAAWDAAVDILEDEMNRIAWPAPAPRMAPGQKFFYGATGTPFVDAANAWWWTLDCLDARHSGGRENAGLRIGRPCEPDDVVNALRRLDVPPTHARTIMAWGKRRDTPPPGSAARQYWDEVMAQLTVVLRAKGIVRQDERIATDAVLAAFDPAPMDEPEPAQLGTPRRRLRLVGQ